MVFLLPVKHLGLVALFHLSLDTLQTLGPSFGRSFPGKRDWRKGTEGLGNQKYLKSELSLSGSASVHLE